MKVNYPKCLLISDEGWDRCGTCPHEAGAQGQRTLESIQATIEKGNRWDSFVEHGASATFSCKHNITKRPICATPCNGVKELCEDDTDEQCQGPGLATVLSITCLFATLYIAVSILIERVLNQQPNMSNNDVLEMDRPFQSNENHKNHILNFKSTLFMSHYNLDFNKAIILASKYYRDISLGGNDTDKQLMHILGTNELTAFFYDCVDKSFMIRISLNMHSRMSNLLNAWIKYRFQRISEVIQSIVKLSIRYSDLAKDILFVYIIWLQLGNYSNKSFPKVIFWTLFSSIVASEVCNCIIIIIYKSKITGRNMMLFLATPFIPALFIYESLQLKLELHNFLRKIDASWQMINERIKKYKNKTYQLELVTAKMQCTENIAENLTQFTVLVMIMSLSHTGSSAVENIDNVLTDNNEILGYALATLSFISMIRGQLTFLKANKNGCLSLKGTLLVAPYFLVGTFSR